MESLDPHLFAELGQRLKELEYSYRSTFATDQIKSAYERGSLIGLLEVFLPSFQFFGFKATVRSVEHIMEIVPQIQSALSPDQFEALLSEFNRHLGAEMGEHLFLWVEPAKIKYYMKDDLLDEPARTAFSATQVEIKEAGNCYVLDRNTASVFHSMRSLEAPIQGLAKRLRVRLPKEIEVASWGEIHREIDNKVVALRQTRHTQKRDEELGRYSEINLEFGYFKDAWRNFVSHQRKDYDSPQALSVLQHVICFINKVSSL